MQSPFENPSARRFNAISWLLMAAGFVAMSWFSWRKWPDLIIDFGAQLYIPWRLSEGEVLYRDIMYLPGPLSPYYHALLFKLFGVALDVVLVSNFILLGGFLLVLWRTLVAYSDHLTATIAALAVIVVFAFSHYLEVGNYNYLCPYSHEATHGLYLSAWMIVLLTRWLKCGNALALSGAGVCYGLTFLTKPEIFLATSATIAGLFWLAPSIEAKGSRVKNAAVFLGSSVFPLGIYFILFFRTEDFMESLRSLGWAWVPLLTTSMAGGKFFQSGFGLDAFWQNLGRMLMQFAGLSALLAFCAWRLKSAHRVERLLLLLGVGGVSLYFDWLDCGRALPLFCATALLLIAWQLKKAPAGQGERLAFPLLWLVFGLFLLAKMGLNSRIFHYGVFLAMPAFVGVIYCLLWTVPRMLAERGVDAHSFRVMVVIFLVIGFTRLAVQSGMYYREKTFPLGDAGDRIMGYSPGVNPSAEGISKALAWIENNTTRQDTIAVLPEGAMINYLSRRKNPTPYLVFMSEVYAFGEDKMAAPYRRNPPDCVLLIHRETTEYGARFFGQTKGYGMQIVNWVEQNYDMVHLIGSEPLQDDRFGIKILRKK